MGSVASTQQQQPQPQPQHAGPIPPPLGDQLDGPPSDPVDWSDVSARLRLHPEEASLYCHSREPSPLHLALGKRNPPPPAAVIRDLVGAYPDAVHHGDGSGATPLHAAASNEGDLDPEIVGELLALNSAAAYQRTSGAGLLPLHRARRPEDVRALLAAYPGAVRSRDSGGRLPLHHIASGSSSAAAVKMLVDEGMRRGVGGRGGGCLVRNKAGRTPLQIAGEGFERTAVLDETGRLKPLSEEAERRWEVVEVMVRAAADEAYDPSAGVAEADGGGGGDSPFRAVHAAIELGCPPSVVARALSLRPTQASERDSLGRTPLALASLRRSSSSGVISVLLPAHPAAARVMDGSGKLPIDLAAESGRDFREGVEELMRAAPQAVETRAVGSRMYPFMAAATAGESSSIDTVYGLLRAGPGVVGHFHFGLCAS